MYGFLFCPRRVHPTDPSQKQDETDAKVDAAPPLKLSKAERRAKHAEFNRQIWESAYVSSRQIAAYS